MRVKDEECMATLGPGYKSTTQTSSCHDLVLKPQPSHLDG